MRLNYHHSAETKKRLALATKERNELQRQKRRLARPILENQVIGWASIILKKQKRRLARPILENQVIGWASIILKKQKRN